MIFISYYSGDKYKICANRLERSLNKFNLPYYIQEINDLGGWEKNNSFKPEFIKEQLLKFKQPVCWLDADNEIRQYPVLLMDKDSDNINYQVYNWYADDDNHITRNNKNIILKTYNWITNNKYISNQKNKLLSSGGTKAFNYSQPTLNYIDEWNFEMKKNPYQAEDQGSDKIFNNNNWISKLKCRWLPKSYLRMERYADWASVNPIINNTETNVCNIINK